MKAHRLRAIALALFAATLVALASTATAGAQTPIEVIDEATAAPCNPCVVHLDGESSIVNVGTGMVLQRCLDEYQLRLYSDGAGEAEWTGVNDAFPNCTLSNCIVMSSHWPIQSEEVAPGVTRLTMRVCHRQFISGAEYECDVEIDATETAPHQYAFNASHVCPQGVRYEINDATEAGDGAVELVHLEK